MSLSMTYRASVYLYNNGSLVKSRRCSCIAEKRIDEYSHRCCLISIQIVGVFIPFQQKYTTIQCFAYNHFS